MLWPLRLGDEAPQLHREHDRGGTQPFNDWKGDSWAILFSHPKDFTPVCTTELGYTAKLADRFEAKNTKVLAVSVDSVEDHGRWVGDIEETQGVAVNYPIVGDTSREVAELYDMIHTNELETLTVRSVFVISPNNKVKLTLTYPASTGRNFDEIERVLDSLQLTAAQPVATPVNWVPGDDVIISPAMSDEDAKARFGDYTTHKPYLRTTSL